MKLAFYPLYKDISTLKDYLFRAMWYLTPFEDSIEELVFFVNFDVNIKTLSSEKHKYLDSSIPQSIKNFKKLRLIRTEKIEVENLRELDYIFVSEETLRNDLIKIKQQNNLKFEILRVDHKNVQYADSFFLRFAEKIPGLHDKYKKISNDKINQYLTKLKRDKVYLFGTGPNFSYTDNVDFSDGLVIACNSMVVSSEIIEKLNPKLFVIADPIFHAGPSSYAESFRSSFLEVLRSRDNPIVVPLRDYHIYTTYFPNDIVERLIPIIFKNESDSEVSQNLDIIKHNYVTTTSNILTLFQLPLASTLGKSIYVSGCDGRPITHNNYFWSHSKSVQINDKMNDIQIAHPAFFDISYDDYYSKHLDTLEAWCSNIEKNGQTVYNLTPSYIPALQSRTIDTIIEKQLKDKTYQLSVIIPLYNAGDFIHKALQSLLESNVKNMEIIIVDDFSDDNSLSTVKEYSEKYENIFVFQNFYTKGVSGARNTGIKLSRGEAVCFLDADDFVYEGSLEKRLAYLNKSDENLIVHSTVKFVGVKDEYLGVEICARKDVSQKDFLNGNPVHFNTLMFKRSVLKYLKFDEKLSNGEDWLAIGKVMELGYDSKYVAEAQSAYRIHPNSTVLKNFDKHEKRVTSVIAHLNRDKSSEEITKILTSRIFSKFVMKILASQDFNIKEFTDDDRFKLFLKEGKNFKNLIKVPLIRTFVLPLNNIDNIEDSLKTCIKEKLDSLDLIIGINNFSIELRNYLKFDSTSNLSYANSLYREGDYEKALTIYTELIMKDNIYKSLVVNINMCKNKLDKTNSFKQKDRFKVVILGKCQAGPIKGMIKNYYKNSEIFDIPFIHKLDKMQINEIQPLLIEADIIITQPFSEVFLGVDYKSLKKKFGNKTYFYPVVYFSGYNPELFYLKDLQGNSLKGFVTDYHDAVVLFGFLNNFSEENISSAFHSPTFFDATYIEEQKIKSLETLRSKEKVCDITISDKIESCLNFKSFYTVNHPTNEIMDELMHRILKRIGLTGKYYGSISKHYEHTQMPMYKSISNCFKINFLDSVIIDKKSYTKKEMIGMYYRYYETLDSSLLKFNLDRLDKRLIEAIARGFTNV